MPDLNATCVLTSSLPDIEKTLSVLGYKHNQDLMKESISYYDVLIHIYDKKENFGTDHCEGTIIASHLLKQWCFWK